MNFMTIPMRRKYVEESIRTWIIFGESDDKKLVDISDGERDVFCSMDRNVANKVMKLHYDFVEKVCELLCH